MNTRRTDPNGGSSCSVRTPKMFLAWAGQACCQLPNGQPWLRRDETGSRRWGCVACHRASLPGPYGSYALSESRSLQLSHLRKHGTSGAHARAVKNYLGSDDPALPAPPLDQFERVWQSRKSGAAYGTELGIGKREKVAKMSWCIAEAKRTLNRRFLRRASACSVMQDERKSRLLIRFKAATKELEVRYGIVRVLQSCGDYVHLTKLFHKALTSFCTIGNGRPHSWSSKPSIIDRKLERHLSKIIKFYWSDAAQTEVLVGECLKTTLDGLSVCSRDKAHGARRVLSRPWKADSFLLATYLRFVGGKRSPARLLQHSPMISQWFQENRDGMAHRIGKFIKNMSACPQRYESHSKPIARCVLNFDSLLQTMVQVSTARAGRAEADHATGFLEWVNEENYLQLAMMSDGGDEGLQLTRSHDDERIDTATITDIMFFLCASHQLALSRQRLPIMWFHEVCNRATPAPTHFHSQQARTQLRVDSRCRPRLCEPLYHAYASLGTACARCPSR